MDLSRNTIASRAWVMSQDDWPKAWEFDQDGTGRYVKIIDKEKRGRVIYHAANWAGLMAFCDGVTAGQSLAYEQEH